MNSTLLCCAELVGGAGLLSLAAWLGEAVPALPAWSLQFGALGLCGYMVWRLHAQQQMLLDLHKAERDDLLAALKRKDDLLDRRGEEVSALSRQNIAAYHRLADLLQDRPCLHEDHRIHSEQ